MTDYRFYRLDQRGKVSTAPTILKCHDDDEARSQGESLAGDFPVEIWDGARRVGTLARGQLGLER